MRRLEWSLGWRHGLGALAVMIAGPSRFGAQGGPPAASSGSQASAPPAPELTFTKDIAPILQRSCENCHRAGRRRADVALHLRRGAALGARHQAAHRHRPARRRDAALVCREEHRHPEVQERSVAERRRDREDREVGRQPARRAAIPPTCRRAQGVDRRDALVDRHARPRSSATEDVVVKADAPDWWGEIRRVPTGLTEDRYVVGARSQAKSTTSDRRAAAAQTVGGRYVFHHMIWRTRVARPEGRPTPAIRSRPRSPASEHRDWPVHEVGPRTPTSSIRSRRGC